MIDTACPFPFAVSPHVHRARQRLAVWTRDHGLIRSPQARERFERADFAWFAGLVHPTAHAEALDLMAEWFAWLFLVDDQLDDGPLGRSPERMTQAVALMRDILDDGTALSATGDALASPVASALADLWHRTAGRMSAAWRRRFVHHLEQCLTTATVWEAQNRVSGAVPSEETYIANRRHTGAIYVCMDLVEFVAGVEVPAECHRSPAFRTALDAACDVVCWVNDVYSYAKERALGEVHNLVHVVGHHRSWDEHRARKEVCAAVSARTDAFLTAEEALRRNHPGGAPWMEPCLAGMRSWMRGNLDWSRRTERYTSGIRESGASAHVEPALMEAGR
ncbi:terpene cyclase [Streptomyces sp. NPDC005963]|uniref:terpene synthase family protein n=1 Tax=Streptomyces sp. NPDC005963 TaxID=3156721 RepID=UPI0033D89AD4